MGQNDQMSVPMAFSSDDLPPGAINGVVRPVISMEDTWRDNVEV